MSPKYWGTTIRSIRISDELWDIAQAVAAERGETVSDVIRRSLESYVEHQEHCVPYCERTTKPHHGACLRTTP